ncbi:unnamed protein product, partial [Leptidea sinapis]
MEIRLKLEEIRRLRRNWHQSHLAADKTRFNRASRELKKMLKELSNLRLKTLELITITLCGASRSVNKPQKHCPPIKSPNCAWAKTDSEKAEAFASYLAEVFRPNDAIAENDESEQDEILSQDLQMTLPLRLTSPREVVPGMLRATRSKINNLLTCIQRFLHEAVLLDLLYPGVDEFKEVV